MINLSCMLKEAELVAEILGGFNKTRKGKRREMYVSPQDCMLLLSDVNVASD
jgi:hypothetical protein